MKRSEAQQQGSFYECLGVKHLSLLLCLARGKSQKKKTKLACPSSAIVFLGNTEARRMPGVHLSPRMTSEAGKIESTRRLFCPKYTSEKEVNKE